MGKYYVLQRANGTSERIGASYKYDKYMFDQEVTVFSDDVISGPFEDHTMKKINGTEHRICPLADLRRADLRGAKLSRSDLSGADLRWADLSDADLRGANLRCATLSMSDLKWAKLNGAKLNGAKLNGSDLRWANLSGANLSGADISWTNLSGADLSEANLSGANLRWAKIRRANLGGANLSGADLDRILIVISGMKWTIYLSAGSAQIGCKIHTIEEWKAFGEAEIKAMDAEALAFWKQHKAMLLDLHASNNWAVV